MLLCLRSVGEFLLSLVDRSAKCVNYMLSGLRVISCYLLVVVFHILDV